MTRKDALITLRNAVQNKTWQPFAHGEPCQFALGAGEWPKRFVEEAYEGSLDAARDLHDELLPEWFWGIQPPGSVSVWNGASSFTRLAECPSRAWLAAMLDALISQEPEA